VGKPYQFGTTRQYGVDMSVEPFLLKPGFCSFAENRTFRTGVNSTRPSISEMAMVFDSDADRAHFESGNMQGVHAYEPNGSSGVPGILACVSGVMFFGKLTGVSIQWTAIDRTMNAEVLSVVFAQGEEQVYWQNGVNNPRAWDGKTVRVLDKANQMPIGNLMCYAHGRIVVADELGRIWVSDHFNGAGTGIRTNMDNFTETMTTGGGFFNAPAFLGRIRAMTVAPYADNWFAQGNVVLGYDNGFATMDIRPQRQDWLGPRVSFTGGGAAGQRCVTSVNSEIWYRRHDGIGAYRQSRGNFESGVDTPVSDEVRPILDADTPFLREFQPMAYFGNRLFCGVWPQRDVYGEQWRVYCEKMVVADLAKGSQSSGLPGLTWEGLWSGVRPTGFVVITADGVRRMLVLSFDQDAKNRCYEMLETITGRDYLLTSSGQESKQIASAWTFSSSMDDDGAFSRKRMSGVSRIILNHQGQFSLEAFIKSENLPEWTQMVAVAAPGNSCVFSCSGMGYQSFSITRSIKTSAFDQTKCNSFSTVPVGVGFWFTIRMQCLGNVSLVGSVFLGDTLDDSTSCLDNSLADYGDIYACQSTAPQYLIH
jgi:hypothetical protein